MWETSAFIRFIDRKLIAEQMSSMKQFQQSMIQKLRDHYNGYDSEANLRDICDGLITEAAKYRLAITEIGGQLSSEKTRQQNQYLVDDNLGMCVYDIFIAGTETTNYTFVWMILFMTYYPEVQLKLRRELATVIGDRLPSHEDRQRCDYTMAYISEILRFRNIVTEGVSHKVLVDEKLGNYFIPKDTVVNVYQGIVMRNDDENYWSRGLDFMPERFLDESDGHYRKPSAAYIPFGGGSRKCIGERFVYSKLFLILVRLLQRTTHIVLDTNGGVGINPDINDFCVPFEFKIKLQTK
ncbi:steroid 17-alpha-hydroxylase/17,20 lyase-like [Oppia nitens]|uniref:steroid 17-alpha-hydroxylase/17,20 lyase-like n=1 Tax=Oppia nitens TaxID=1686743 RepID=UPI0023DA3FE7|nr:steroid 17-alpha-hydroxylase/17,20 lyase-like [Oppia nitens]